MLIAKKKVSLILLIQLALTLSFATLYFTQTADIVAEHSNYFIAIALVPFLFGFFVGLFWHLVNSRLSLIDRNQFYLLISAHAVTSLLPTALYLIVMSLL